MLAVHRKTGAAIVREGDPSGSIDFVLEDHDGRLAVKDLDSHLGTIFNGIRMAKFEERSIAGLTRGPNEVQAGGVASPIASGSSSNATDDPGAAFARF